MISCDNCDSDFSYTDEGALMVRRCTADGIVVYATKICARCTAGVEVVKIVLRRGKEKTFEYDQYMAVEMTRKAFGQSV